MSSFNCPDRRKSGIFNRPMALIAVIIGIVAAISSGHAHAAKPAAFQSALEPALK